MVKTTKSWKYKNWSLENILCGFICSIAMTFLVPLFILTVLGMKIFYGDWKGDEENPLLAPKITRWISDKSVNNY